MKDTDSIYTLPYTHNLKKKKINSSYFCFHMYKVFFKVGILVCETMAWERGLHRQLGMFCRPEVVFMFPLVLFKRREHVTSVLCFLRSPCPFFCSLSPPAGDRQNLCVPRGAHVDRQQTVKQTCTRRGADGRVEKRRFQSSRYFYTSS